MRRLPSEPSVPEKQDRGRFAKRFGSPRCAPYRSSSNRYATDPAVPRVASVYDDPHETHAPDDTPCNHAGVVEHFKRYQELEPHRQECRRLHSCPLCIEQAEHAAALWYQYGSGGRNIDPLFRLAVKGPPPHGVKYVGYMDADESAQALELRRDLLAAAGLDELE